MFLGRRVIPDDDFAMVPALELIEGIRVVIDGVAYTPSLLEKGSRGYPYLYTISIHNDTAVPITVRARKWVVKESNGFTNVIEGNGVVGQTPQITPGGQFTYQSYHLVEHSAEVSGSYFVHTAAGDFGYAPIPNFSLKPPTG